MSLGRLSLMAAAALAAGTTSLLADSSSIAEILSNPEAYVQIRPRYEYVDVDNDGKDEANAFTVRTVVGMNFAKVATVDGLKATLEATDVSNFGWVTDYAPEDTKYPVVADGTQTRVTQANISYSANDFTVSGGRSMVNLDNQRFIGAVDWRQMPQTFDLVALSYSGVKNLSLLGAYVSNVNRVFNADCDGALCRHLSTGSVILHGAYKFAPELTLTAYDYMIQNFADHIGIRATGSTTVGDVKLAYEGEYAIQDDPSLDESDEPLYSATRKQDASYYKVGLDATYSKLTVGAAYEFLSDKGDGDMAFSTPLATLHAMNGWADMFLATPAQGLTDLAVKVGYDAGDYGNIVAIYHAFSSDSKNTSGDDDLGNEIDVAYNYKIRKNLGLLLKGAWYNAGDASFGYNDTTKMWAMLDYKFSSK